MILRSGEVGWSSTLSPTSCYSMRINILPWFEFFYGRFDIYRDGCSLKVIIIIVCWDVRALTLRQIN